MAQKAKTIPRKAKAKQKPTPKGKTKIRHLIADGMSAQEATEQIKKSR